MDENQKSEKDIQALISDLIPEALVGLDASMVLEGARNNRCALLDSLQECFTRLRTISRMQRYRAAAHRPLVVQPLEESFGVRFLQCEPSVVQRDDSYYPPVGEVFELSLIECGDAADPSRMVEADGCLSAAKWLFSGTDERGAGTRQFQLLPTDPAWKRFSEFSDGLALEGRIPSGQWREAFRLKFPNPPPGVRPVGILDPSWHSPSPGGVPHFPYIGPRGETHFRSIAVMPSIAWLWLVEMDGR